MIQIIQGYKKENSIEFNCVTTLVVTLLVDTVDIVVDIGAVVVVDCPRNLYLKFGENMVLNS